MSTARIIQIEPVRVVVKTLPGRKVYSFPVGKVGRIWGSPDVSHNVQMKKAA